MKEQEPQKKNSITLDHLAVMVAKGFEQTGKDIGEVKKDIIQVREDIARLERKIEALSQKLSAHLDLSDKRYLELKRRDAVIAKWVKQVAEKTGVPIDLAELEKF